MWVMNLVSLARWAMEQAKVSAGTESGGGSKLRLEPEIYNLVVSICLKPWACRILTRENTKCKEKNDI